MKAKDLMGKNIEDLQEESGEPKQEDDQVAAAYENISKKLSSLRGGASEEEDEKDSKDVDEVELEEWKGPKPPSKEDLKPIEDEDEDAPKAGKDDEDTDEDRDLRKVKLHNLEDADSEDEEKEGGGDEEEDDLPIKSAKEWKPAEDDPLDEEEEEGGTKKENKEAGEDDAEELDMDGKSADKEEDDDDSGDLRSHNLEPVGKDDEDKRSDDLEPETAVHSELSVKPDDSEMEDDLGPKKPDTLDDLADESPFVKHKQAPEGNEEEEEEGYAIPHLRTSRQEGGNVGYNAPPQREGLGQSYAPRGNNMEGNDPNNFFSQHQPQPAKRANKFHLLILVIIGIVVIGFTVYILKGGFGDIKIGGTTTPSPSPSATATPEATPTPTPEPTVERGGFTVRVLNGTSTSGLAGQIRDKMRELGYKTSTPGNASDSDVEQTEIRVKEGSESASLYETLKLDLAPDYEAVEGEKLDDKVAYDAEVTIGAK